MGTKHFAGLVSWCRVAGEEHEARARYGASTPMTVSTTSISDVSCANCLEGLRYAFYATAAPSIGSADVTTSPTGGMRANVGKRRMSLISPWALEGLADVLTFGEKKYAAWNWAKGLEWSKTLDSLERHLTAFKRGEDVDPESGLPHIDHVLTNCMFLSHMFRLGPTYKGLDDRWHVPENLKQQPATQNESMPLVGSVKVAT